METARLSEAFIERELGRALNKTDFFRAFKMHADFFGLTSFLLLDIEKLVLGDCLQTAICLSKLSVDNRAAFEEIHYDNRDMFLGEVVALNSPRIWSGPLFSRYCDMFSATSIYGIPGPMGIEDPFRLLLGDSRGERDREQLRDMFYDFSNIMMRYSDFNGTRTDAPSLSKRELEVTHWTAEGKTTAEIAIILGLSEYTVNEYVGAAMRKIDAVSRGHLVAKALRMGIIE